MKIRDAVPVSPPPAAWDVDCSGDPGLTRQEFAKDCDVNEIIRRCVRYGVSLPGDDARAVFADVSNVGDFSDAMRRVRAAEETFMALPADLRLRFGNDPAQLIDFVSNDANREEAVKLGLVAPRLVPPAAAPVPAPVAPLAALPPAAT